MSAKELSKRLERVAEEWPAGCLVWHRASGKRGVVVEYAIDGIGAVMIVVDYGNGPWDKELPIVLSATRISDGADGDEWKEGAGV